MTIEHAAFTFEVRDIARGPYTTIEGRAVPYNVWANVGPYMERFAPNAFKKSISEGTKPLPLMLFHGRDEMWPIGAATRWQSKEDGLYGTWRLNSGENAERAAQMAESGELGYLSIGFVPIRNGPPQMAKDYNPELGEDHMDWFTRVEARLVETSVVPTPAYVEAEITLVRSYKHESDPVHLLAWQAERDRLQKVYGGT